MFVAQTLAPYWVPCHQHIDYDDPNWKENITKDRTTQQCVGHAIMRDKSHVADLMPDELITVASFEGDNVFESLVHFYAYHKQISIEDAEKELTVEKVFEVFHTPGTQFHPVKS